MQLNAKFVTKAEFILGGDCQDQLVVDMLNAKEVISAKEVVNTKEVCGENERHPRRRKKVLEIKEGERGNAGHMIPCHLLCDSMQALSSPCEPCAAMYAHQCPASCWLTPHPVGSTDR